MSGTKMANDININVVAQVQGAIQPLQQVQQQVQRVGGAIDRSTAAVNRNSVAYTRNGRNLARWAKGGLQQAGYQVGDFAVQVANGTSGIQAFGQQGSQLLGIFGPIGALLGAGVAIFSAFALVVERAGGGFDRYFQIFSGFTTAFGIFIDKMAVVLSHFTPMANVIGNILTSAYAMLGSAIQIVTDNLSTLATAAGIFVAIQLAGIVLNTARNFVTFAKAISISNVVMRLLNATVRRSPFTLLAVAMGIAAERAGLLAEGLDQLRQRFPEFFEDAEEAVGSFRDMIGEAGAAFNELLNTPLVVNVEDNLDDVISGAGAAAQELDNTMKNLGKSISGSMEDAFMSIVDGTMTAKDAFKSMAKSIIAELYRVLVVQRAVAAITGALGNMGGFFGSLFPARAQGGAVSANRPYVVGEKGPEMLVPSTSGRVIPNNQLGGGSGGQVIVNQTINVSTGVQQTVRTEIKQLMPQIAESAKQAVVDAKRRGGSYGRAFA